MTDIVPQNEAGGQSNTESSVELSSNTEAEKFYEIVRDRLFSFKDWHQYAGAISADFTLTDKDGNDIDRLPQKGDFLRISIPGPGNKTGEGYDWVQIEDIEYEKIENGETLAIKVRPAPSPVNKNDDVAHFFSDEATSSFIVSRKGNKVTASVFGRNEHPNTDADAVVDKIRNVAVATGAMTAFSKFQWKGLVDGLVKQ